MNYSEFTTVEENKVDISNIRTSDAKAILEDFEILTTNLDEYKKKIEDLMKNKNYFDNYVMTMQNNHLNIINIINDYNINNNDENNKTTEIFISYNTKIKENYNNWIINYYTVKLLEYENTIEIIEQKIADFRNLFIYIINKMTKPNVENKKLCPICFENEVDLCLNPCGHTICNRCIMNNYNNNNRDKCYSCRTIIKDYIRIYFSL